MTSLASLLLIALWSLLIPKLVNGLGSSSSLTLAVVYGTATVCGIVAGKPTQRVRCYQSNDDEERIISVLPDISFQEISGGRSFFCGLRHGGLNLLCWDGASLGPKRIYHSDTVELTDLTVGHDQVCTREAVTGFAKCWRGGGGEPSNGGHDLEPFRDLGFSKIACGSGFVCGILSNNNSVFCWGSSKNSTGHYYNHEIFRARSEFGNLSMLSLVAGESHACGLTVSGSLICRGSNESGQLNVPSDASNFEYSGLALGANFTCAIRRANGSVTCWGGDFDTDYGIGWVSFDSIAAGFDFVCGLSRIDSSVFCWGPGWSMSRSYNTVPIGPLVQSSHPETLSQGEFPLAVEPLSPISSHKHVPPSSKLLLVFLIVALVAFSISFFSLLWRLRSSAPGPRSAAPCIHNPEKFSLAELAAATGDFSSGNRIGFGSFGEVYRGKLSDGREVAVKRGHSRTKEKSFREKETAFESELAALSRLRHKHLVALVGFCQENDERLLVYDYMPNGSLHHHLHGSTNSVVLGSWKVRIRIALEAARGIKYLHDRADPPVIHRDIKSSNILLDSGMAAKLSDFGLSATGQAVPGAAAGTIGYIDPEYYASNVFTTKSDVYGLGVVMLELLTGKKAVFRSDDGGGGVTTVVEFVETGLVLDERVTESDGGEGGPAVKILAATALRCVSVVGVWRPSVVEVVASLETAYALCQ